jgi:Ca2+-binding RTX toxin-like protein
MKTRSRHSKWSQSKRSQVERASAGVIEQLEERRLMSMATGGSFGGSLNLFKTFYVGGTAGDDTIVVSQSNGYLEGYVNGVLQSSMPEWQAMAITVRGLAGNDSITVADSVGMHVYARGDDGCDTFFPSRTVNQDFYGGAGEDLANYSGRIYDLNVSLDDVANDGEYGHADNIHSDVERVYGGDGNDSLTGSAGNNLLYGGAGWDSLSGGWGDDSLSGGDGNDTLVGDDGDDTLMGGMGQDLMMGCAGTDRVDYSDRFYAVYVSLDYGWNDGQYTEHDLVFPDIEVVIGGWGNDSIVGTNGDDVLFGGAGNDTLVGLDGNDTLEGSLGNDKVLGGDGNDDLRGGPHNDALFGGPGDDRLAGGDDNDTLVSIGGGQSDTLSGDGGFDSFWADPGDNLAQWDYNEYTAGHINQFYGFKAYHFSNGTNYWPSTDPDGQDLPDPELMPNNGGIYWRSFADKPIFSTSGPIKDDVDQQYLGDCYFMATLSSIAKTNPDRIRQSVTELGDGTYAVRFWDGSTPQYVRVDADLPTDWAGTPVYARLGTQQSMWVAIMEKAWAFYRHNDSKYASAEGGFPSEVYSALGCSSTKVESTWGYRWANKPDDLWNYIAGELGAGKSVTACTGSPSNPELIVGDHCYEVDSVYIDGMGVRHVVVRNPWGPAGDSSAYVDLTAAQFMVNFDEVDSAWV